MRCSPSRMFILRIAMLFSSACELNYRSTRSRYPGGIYSSIFALSFTYDHRALKPRLPVRSALFKQRTGGLVVRWVTTSEYPLLYVFGQLFA
jgi:hypothetical protein